MKYRLEIENQSHKIELLKDRNGSLSAILIDDQKFPISDIESLTDAKIKKVDEKYTLEYKDELINLKFKEIQEDQLDDSSENNNLSQMKEFFKEGKLLAPMPGKIIDLRCSEGSIIGQGKIVLSLEAMKMENEIHTPYKIEIKKILVNVSDSVIDKQLLLEYEIIEEN